MKVIRNWKKRWLCQVQTCFKLKNGFLFTSDANQDDFNWGKCTWGFFYYYSKNVLDCITHIVLNIIRTYVTYVCVFIALCTHSAYHAVEYSWWNKNRTINVQLNGVIDQSMRIVMEFYFIYVERGRENRAYSIFFYFTLLLLTH